MCIKKYGKKTLLKKNQNTQDKKASISMQATQGSWAETTRVLNDLFVRNDAAEEVRALLSEDSLARSVLAHRDSPFAAVCERNDTGVIQTYLCGFKTALSTRKLWRVFAVVCRKMDAVRHPSILHWMVADSLYVSPSSTVLHWMVEENLPVALRVLLETHANASELINARTSASSSCEGFTAFHLALTLEVFEAARILLACGADATMTSCCMTTATMLSDFGVSEEIAALRSMLGM